MLTYRSKLDLCIIIISIFFIMEVVLMFVHANEAVISFNKHLSCLILLWAYVVARVSGKGFFHPFTLYLVAFTTFIFSRLIMDVMGLYSFDDTYFFSNEVKHKMILVVSFATISLIWGALFSFRRNLKNNITSHFQETSLSLVLRKYGLYLIGITIVPFLILKIKTLIDVATQGYVYAMYLEGGLQDSQGWFDKLLGISDNIFYTGIFLYLATYPKGKMYKWSIFIFFIASIIELGSGRRGPTICNIFVLLAYLGSRGLKLSIKKICLLSLGLVVFLYLSFAFVLTRNDSIADIGSVETESLSFVVENVFWQQGATLCCAIGETIYMEKKLEDKELYIFSPMHDLLFGSVFSDILGIRRYNPSVQDENTLEKSWRLGGKIMYNMDPEGYYEGYGTGSSMVAESYCCGGVFGVMFWPFLFMFMFTYFWDKYKYNPVIFFLLLSGLSQYFFSPRDPMFRFMTSIFYAFIFISLIRLLMKYVPKRSTI